MKFSRVRLYAFQARPAEMLCAREWHLFTNRVIGEGKHSFR